MTVTEAKQLLVLEIVRATAGNYTVEEVLELYYFMIEPEEERTAILSVITNSEA
jgi:hypothetical protein